MSDLLQVIEATVQRHGDGFLRVLADGEEVARGLRREVERLRAIRDKFGEPADLAAEVERLRTAANSARALLERHRATRGSTDLLTTALRELDDVLPPVVTTQQNHKPEERSGA